MRLFLLDLWVFGEVPGVSGKSSVFSMLEIFSIKYIRIKENNLKKHFKLLKQI